MTSTGLPKVKTYLNMAEDKTTNSLAKLDEMVAKRLPGIKVKQNKNELNFKFDVKKRQSLNKSAHIKVELNFSDETSSEENV